MPMGVRYALQAHPGKYRRPPNSQPPNEARDSESVPKARLEITSARRRVNPKHSVPDWDTTNAGATTGWFSLATVFRTCTWHWEFRPPAWTSQDLCSSKIALTCDRVSCAAVFRHLRPWPQRATSASWADG
ncbi:hypothetical protein mRhiFer1_009761 [Rhinolophus ferrumequinum]|uniref:Uncharacterized protein n=1 Tax=Rhinolophus ferrumequinum TaxID=59479 RepID=A0A7J7ZCP0_RHIFE|nr:hypothetical protein mRhiFer1_009761 [Rhinolophus ferrumequinum]